MTPDPAHPDRPRWRRRLAITLALGALLLGGAVAVAPLLVDRAAVRRVIEREISARLGGKVRYDSLGLRLFPFPRAEVRGVTVQIPDSLAGRAAALDVELSLTALLRGTVRPTAIRVKQPVLEAPLASGGGAADPVAAYRETLGPIVETLVREVPGMSLQIVDGQLDVLRDGRPVVALSKLAAQVDVAPDAIDARVSAGADLWRAAEARLRITPGSLAGSASVEVRGLEARVVLEALGAGGALAVRPGAVDARVEAQTDGQGAGRATIDASSPELVLERGPRQLAVGAVRVAAEVARDPKTLTVSLRRLELGDVVPGATGTLRANADGTAPALDLEMATLDLARLREGALRLASDVDGVRAVADVVRAGTLRSLRIAGAGRTFVALAGAIRPTEIRVEQPVLEVRLGPGGGASDPFTAYRASLGPIVDALAREAPGLSAQVVDGRLDVLRAGRPVVALSKVAAQVDVTGDAVAVRMTSAADRWRTAEGHLRVAPGSLAGSATLRVQGLETQGLLEALGAAGALTMRSAAVDGSLEARTDGHGAVHTTLDAASPRLTLERGARRLELGAARLGVEVARDAKTWTVSLRRLELGDLLAGATGSLRVPAAEARPTVEVTVPALDLAPLRERALLLAGDVEGVRVAAGIVRAGTLRGLRVASAGSGLAALGDLRVVRAEAGLDGGEVALPDLGITVKNGRGPLALTGGTLRGSQLSGTIGTSSFRDGTLALALVPAVVLQDMRVAVDADLADALAITRRTLDPAGVAALADVEALQGRAEGRIAFEQRGGRPSHQVAITRVHATGRHRRLPWPVLVSSGAVQYAPDALSVRDLSAALGRSRVTGVSADVTLDAQRTVRAARGDMVLDLGELYPWLASLDRLRPALQEIQGMTGKAAVRLARMSGALADPEALDFEAGVEPDAVRAVLTEFPGPLTLARGKASITPRAVQLDRLEAALLDARVTASGRVENYASADARRLDLTLAAGAAGAQSLDWLRKRWSIDPAAFPRPPVALSAGRLHWSADESSEHAAQGTLHLAGDARAEIDLTWGPEIFHLRHFALKDADSDATGSARWEPARASLAFSGRIDDRSIGRIMGRRPEALTRVEGRLRAQIDLAEPQRSTATGSLTGEGLFLEHWGVPVSIERVRVDARGGALTIHDALVKVAGQRVSVGGGVAVRPKTFAVNLRVAADRLDADSLLQALPTVDRERPSKRSVWDVPMDGQVEVGAKSLVVAERVVDSITGTVRLAPRRAVVDVTKASLCGVSVPFTATFTPEMATVSGRIVERGAPLETVVPCVLPGRDLVASGRFDINAEYTASGPPGELVQGLSGTFRATGRGGRIQYTRLAPKLLALQPVAEQMEAEYVAEVAARGLAFTRVAAVATLDAGRVRLERFTLDSWALGLGLTGEIDLAEGQLGLRGVIAPLGNVTGALRRVPVVGRLFGARIVGVPFSVRGDWHDPRVTPLGPEAIAGTFVDLLSRTLNAPIRLLRPLLPSRERAP